MERKIGEIFTYNSKTYQVVKGITCKGCAFMKNKGCHLVNELLGPCDYATRSDKTGVIFKEINNMEEIKNNQLAIDIPEGMEIDTNNSDLAKGIIKFKKKELTYDTILATFSGISVHKEHINKLQAISQLMTIAKYYNNDWQPNWSNSKENKYCIKFDYHKDRFYVDYNNSIGASDVFFKNSEDARAIINNPNFKSILNTVYKN